MALRSDCCDDPPGPAAGSELGVGRYFGQVARTYRHAQFDLSTLFHFTARKLPDHAHDWPFLSTLLRGSYVSRTRLQELEFRHGVAVYHPHAFQHCDEIGCDGGAFFGVQFDPALLRDATDGSAACSNDVAVLQSDEAYGILGRLFCALQSGADDLVLESLAADLAGCLVAPMRSSNGAMPAWLNRTEQHLRERRHGSLHELAQDAGVHVTTLTRLFRRHMRCSIGGFVARERARRAFFAVTGSRLSLAEISHDLDFADQSHMTRMFKRAFSATPGQLRRMAAPTWSY